MAVSLRTFWEDAQFFEQALILPDGFSKEHLERLDVASNPPRPIASCELLGGLLDGVQYSSARPNQKVAALLKGLQAAGREVVIMHTTIQYSAETALRRHFPNEFRDVEIRNKLGMGLELSDMGRGITSKAEILISPYPEKIFPLDHRVHVSVLNPSSLQ